MNDAQLIVMNGIKRHSLDLAEIKRMRVTTKL